MSIIGVPARRRIAVVSAGLSQRSSTRLLADQLADAARRELERGGAEVEIVVVELRELAHDIVNNLLTGFPSATLRRAVGDVSGADALVAVTPIFNASYSGLFKSFVDVLDPEALVDMPVLVGATGGTGLGRLGLCGRRWRRRTCRPDPAGRCPAGGSCRTKRSGAAGGRLLRRHALRRPAGGHRGGVTWAAPSRCDGRLGLAVAWPHARPAPA